MQGHPATRHAISIHALLAESDEQKCGDGKAYVYFYPRSPCGERLDKPAQPVPAAVQFLSTLSLRRATMTLKCPKACQKFLSTLSLRRATSVTTSFQGGFAISIHALLAESDLKGQLYTSALIQISIHALLAESDHQL